MQHGARPSLSPRRGPPQDTQALDQPQTPIEPRLLPSSLPPEKVHIAVCSKVLGITTARPSTKTGDGFDPESVHVGFVVDKVALGQVFPRVLRVSSVNLVPPVLYYL